MAWERAPVYLEARLPLRKPTTLPAIANTSSSSVSHCRFFQPVFVGQQHKCGITGEHSDLAGGKTEKRVHPNNRAYVEVFQTPHEAHSAGLRK